MAEENYCAICNLRFSNYSGLCKHNKKYHVQIKEEVKPKPVYT